MDVSLIRNLSVMDEVWQGLQLVPTSPADVGLMVGVGLMLYLAYRALARKRFIEDLPLSTCAGVTVGMCRLHAKARAAHASDLLKAPGSGSPVVYWSERVEEQVAVVEEEPPTRQRRRHRRVRYEWREVSRRASRASFWLEDETGRVEVDPGGAEMHTRVDFQEVIEVARAGSRRRERARRRGGRTGLRRREVRVIHSGEEVSIIGPARLTQAADRLRIGPGNWNAPEYVITTLGEAKLTQNYGRWALFLLLVALALLGWWAGSGGVVESRAIRHAWAAPGEYPGARALLMAWALACVLMLYLKVIFDGMVALQNRVERAWSMLEVELARRHHLISTLVDLVRGYGAHEAEVMREVARRRNPALAGERGSEVRSRARSERDVQATSSCDALAEAYPNLRSSEHYLRLMDALRSTEDRVAWARTFYNDSVERHNTRLQRFPDRMVWRVFGVRPAPSERDRRRENTASDP
ncbi:hypothetical protein EA187_03280 [Lujinxingia sediminis]|uniref:RING-type E3 ubiquitin transferase n=1 Tax=Lujinxingia sediminis TaxID=2480984 RepID=A0ABY0CY16_9DELT|nr:LemA family protein [Lujinxingia sediminis]RVU48471.1 hypothetical protein EA187_03280 [Lujinxingia sediminis]